VFGIADALQRDFMEVHHRLIPSSMTPDHSSVPSSSSSTTSAANSANAANAANANMNANEQPTAHKSSSGVDSTGMALPSLTLDYVAVLRQKEDSHKQLLASYNVARSVPAMSTLLGEWKKVAHLIVAYVKEAGRRVRAYEKMRGQARILRQFSSSMDERFLRMQYEQERLRRVSMDVWFREQQARHGVRLATSEECGAQTEGPPDTVAAPTSSAQPVEKAATVEHTVQTDAPPVLQVGEDFSQTEELREKKELEKVRAEWAESMEQVALLVAKMDVMKEEIRGLKRGRKDMLGKIRDYERQLGVPEDQQYKKPE
jgi:hypothetical protein